jgi:secreted PhoX family phosphatase
MLDEPTADRPATRRLPMAGLTRGKRSPVTCHLKCDDACARPAPNPSDGPTFREVASAVFSRRSLLRGAGAGALIMLGGALGAPAAAAAPFGSSTAGPTGSGGGAVRGPGRLRFAGIAPVPADVDALTVPEGYRWATVVRWGDPLFDAAETFDAAAQTPQRQARQFGYNNDYLDLIPIPGRGDREALLVANHEYTNAPIMFPPAASAEERQNQRRVTKAAQGMAVVHVRRDAVGQPWRVVVGSRYNRRITADTPISLDGPIAGAPILRTKDDPSGTTVLGTFANCSGGTTPWGTVLSGEENFQGYFRTSGAFAADKRYGLTDKATTYGWEEVDPRFDARGAGYETEPNRFGWIVELDPFSPDQPPVKHTAMGRFKHEGANVIVGRSGHVGAYMGDDERFDYVYKFVSTNRMKSGSGSAARQANKSLLSSGSLYVARFTGNSPADQIDGSGRLPADGAFDGTGEWLPIVVDGVSQVPGFNAEQALVYSRLAADQLGATRMDRPEDVQPSPVTGKVYVVCTNNIDRGKAGAKEGATEVNPRTPNRDGHIVEITEDGGDLRSRTFTWSVVLVCGDPAAAGTYFAGFPHELVAPISCPDNIAFDSRGDLWIATDGAPSTLGHNDGLFHMPLSGADRGYLRQFLAVPREAETCGPVIRDAEGTVLVAVQHPGEEGTFAAPHSYFPDYVAQGADPGPGQWRGPRPSVVQVWRDRP